MPLKIAKYCSVPGCGGAQSLHTLPSDSVIRNAWLEFIFKDTAARMVKSMCICSLHFTPDSFVNKAQLEAGFAERLRLKSNAVPSIWDPTRMPQQSYTNDSSSLLSIGRSPVTKNNTQTSGGSSANGENDKCGVKTRIDIGRAFPLWQRVREQKGFKSDADMAFYLLQSVCGESLLQRKRGRESKPDSDGDWTPDSEDHQSSDEDKEMEASETPVPCQTDESSENGLKSEPQEISVVQIKSEDHIDQDTCKAPAASTENTDTVPQRFTSNTTKKEIKEEPETELDNRLEVSTGPVASSQKFDDSFAQTPNPETEKRARLSTGQLVPNKTQMSGLFPTCLQCGGPVQEYTTISSGNQNLQWKCSKGHLTWLVQNSNPS